MRARAELRTGVACIRAERAVRRRRSRRTCATSCSRTPGVKYPVLAGLAEDYIGYIVPVYNFVLDPDNPYINEAEGDHYEEVYSLGPLVEQHAIHPILQLLQIP